MKDPTCTLKSAVGAQRVFENREGDPDTEPEDVGWVGLGPGNIWEAVK